MADLLDIVPSTAVEVVKIDGQRVTVRGLRVDAVASIVARFPNIVGLLLGGLSTGDIGPKFIGQFGAAVGPIIAAGCGHLGDEKYEQHASTAFLLEDQLRLVTAIIRATCPNGFGFFAEMLTKLNSAAGEEARPVKVRLKKSPLQSPPSSDAAFRPTMQ
jgi:hypothetical protein